MYPAVHPGVQSNTQLQGRAKECEGNEQYPRQQNPGSGMDRDEQEWVVPASPLTVRTRRLPNNNRIFGYDVPSPMPPARAKMVASISDHNTSSHDVTFSPDKSSIHNNTFSQKNCPLRGGQSTPDAVRAGDTLSLSNAFQSCDVILTSSSNKVSDILKSSGDHFPNDLFSTSRIGLYPSCDALSATTDDYLQFDDLCSFDIYLPQPVLSTPIANRSRKPVEHNKTSDFDFDLMELFSDYEPPATASQRFVKPSGNDTQLNATVMTSNLAEDVDTGKQLIKNITDSESRMMSVMSPAEDSEKGNYSRLIAL